MRAPRLTAGHYKFAAVAGLVGVPYLLLMHFNPSLLLEPYRAARAAAAASAATALDAARASPPPPAASAAAESRGKA